jgi:hypothetical protein
MGKWPISLLPPRLEEQVAGSMASELSVIGRSKALQVAARILALTLRRDKRLECWPRLLEAREKSSYMSSGGVGFYGRVENVEPLLSACQGGMRPGAPRA